MFRGTFQPYASRSRFPAFSTLVLFRRRWIEIGYPYIKDHVVFVGQFGLALALDVYEGVVDPTPGEVKVFVDAVPFLRIEFAAGEEVEGRAGSNRYVGNDKAMLMRWQCVVDGVWENVEAVIE